MLVFDLFFIFMVAMLVYHTIYIYITNEYLVEWFNACVMWWNGIYNQECDISFYLKFGYPKIQCYENHQFPHWMAAEGWVYPIYKTSTHMVSVEVEVAK